MPTPPKPFVVLSSEGKSHRTKKELRERKVSEDALITGRPMREFSDVRTDPDAHERFKKINALLKGIGKNDAIYEGVINRYCLLHSECLSLNRRKNEVNEDLRVMSTPESRASMEPTEYYKMRERLAALIVSLDRQLQTKRKMMLDIEKENIMTIAASLRSVPKTPVNLSPADGLRRKLRDGS